MGGALDALIPRPSEVTARAGHFALTEDTTITVPEAVDDRAAAELLAGYLRPATGLPLAIAEPAAAAGGSRIAFTTAGADAGAGDEGYELRIDPEGVEVVAGGPAGLAWAVQTIRQLLSAEVESRRAHSGPWLLPAATITDALASRGGASCSMSLATSSPPVMSSA